MTIEEFFKKEKEKVMDRVEEIWRKNGCSPRLSVPSDEITFENIQGVYKSFSDAPILKGGNIYITIDALFNMFVENIFINGGEIDGYIVVKEPTELSTIYRLVKADEFYTSFVNKYPIVGEIMKEFLQDVKEFMENYRYREI